MFTLKKYGRKPILILGTAILGACLLAFSIFLFIKESHKVIAIVGLIVSATIYNISLLLSIGPIMWLYLPEIVQPNKIPYAITLNWLVGSLILFLFPIVRGSCGNRDCPQIFVFFAFCMFIGSVICYVFMV